MRIGSWTIQVARLLALAGLGLVALTLMGGRSVAQLSPVGFFEDPILILTGNGHHAPVRSMAFAINDGSQLLTGGMDKVIHVWNLDVDRSGPSRTLRPPLWRGYAGHVNALALSPMVEPGNQRLLAIAGYGVLGDRGEILLIRYPGPTGQGTGDVEGQLFATVRGTGHGNAVTSLAFTPDGRFLASASDDKTVRLWEIATRRSVAVLTESTAEVNSLAIFRGGTRLVAGGVDGVLRLYNITDPMLTILIKSAAPVVGRASKPEGDRGDELIARRILSVAVSPDDQWIYSGTGGGAIVRYESLNLREATFLPDVPPDAVQAIAISPDGTRMATSVLAQRLNNAAERPEPNCQVDIRSMPDGRLLERLPMANNLVQALAFSPNSKRLAYSGGDAQAVFIKELAPNAPPADEIRGAGSSLWDVGFRPDGLAVRFARDRAQRAGEVVGYEYFDLKARSFFNPGPNEPAYRHAVATEVGWSIRPVDQFQIDFLGPGRTWRKSLDPLVERRWWAYTVIPSGPGHPEPVAAVATDAAVVLWNLRTGEKTRVLAGHSGPVYALASSIDGKWLVTGSSDQTVRIWSLMGCDQPSPFGARFVRRPDGVWVVADVTPSGIADGIGLKKGHVIEEFFVNQPPKDPNIYLPKLDTEGPSDRFSFYVRMNGDPAEPRLGIGSTKRDSPALSLFPAIDHRWVLWTPRGYYDSSADGDRKFLGWLTNRGTIPRLLAGTFDSIDKFENKYRQPKSPRPNAIDRLLDTGDPLRAIPEAAIGVPADPTNSRMPVLTLKPINPAPADRPLVVNSNTLRLAYQAITENRPGFSRIKRLWIEVNGRKFPEIINANQPVVPSLQGELDVTLGNERDVRAVVVVVDDKDVVRMQPVDFQRTVLPTSPRKSSLEIVAIAAEEFPDKRFPRILYAEDDASDLLKFFADRLIDPTKTGRFSSDQIHRHEILGGRLASNHLVETFDGFKKAAVEGQLGSGDVIVVTIDSHFLEFRSQRFLATTEPDINGPVPPSLSATDLGDRLGELTGFGIRVFLMIDAVHEVKEKAWDNDIQEWVRRLQTQGNIVAFIAADHGPSFPSGPNTPSGDGHRIFAQAILDVFQGGKSSRTLKAEGPLSLFEFQRTVTEIVLQQTGRKQHAQCYLPEKLSIQSPFLDPSTPPRR